nr:permease [Natronomonas sp. LN261]
MWSYLVELASILPAVMVLLGLFNEWVPTEMVVQYLGEQTGATGVGIAVLLGSTPTGPLYVAFPIAADLLEKDASVTNVVVFLTAWACLKLPQELIELQFLGWRFMTLRLALTAAVAVGMGLAMQALLSTESPHGSS